MPSWHYDLYPVFEFWLSEAAWDLLSHRCNTICCDLSPVAAQLCFSVDLFSKSEFLSFMKLKIPPLLQLVILGSLMWFSSIYADNFSFNFKYNNEFALFCLTAGVAIIGFGIVTFRMAKTTTTPLYPDQASNLVTTGIYQYTRNPMYLGLLLILFSIGWYLQNLASMFVLPIYVWFISKYQIIPEEEALQKVFGQDYKNYQDRVRRWI